MHCHRHRKVPSPTYTRNEFLKRYKSIIDLDVMKIYLKTNNQVTAVSFSDGQKIKKIITNTCKLAQLPYYTRRNQPKSYFNYKTAYHEECRRNAF